MARNPGGEMRSDLGKRQAKFVKEYLVDLNAAAAAIRAGYSARTAKEIGYENLTKPHIAAEIARQQAERSQRLEVDADRVVQELAKVAFSNMADYMSVGVHGDPVLDWSVLTRNQAAALREVTVETYTDGHGEEALGVKRVKFRLADKIAALDKLARHLGVYNDTLELKGRVTLEQLVAASFKPDADDTAPAPKD